MGTQVVGRAFVQAYRQAAANSAAAAANGGSKATTAKLTGSNVITKQMGIDLEEACKILNIKKEGLVIEEINKVFLLRVHITKGTALRPSFYTK